MAKTRYVCEYCNKSFEDSQEARRRHFAGRNHKANVQLWYASYDDQARLRGSTASVVHTSAAAAMPPSMQWTPATTTAPPPPPTESSTLMDVQQLPPSMIPPPPSVFSHTRADWG